MNNETIDKVLNILVEEQLTFVEALGVLEIAKQTLFKNAEEGNLNPEPEVKAK